MSPLIRIATAACLAPLLTHAVDFDNNGYDDIWESLYAASSLDPTADTDGDGCSNLDESLAGTDPRDPADCFAADSLDIAPTQVLFDIPTEPGKLYQLESNTALTSTGWQAQGAPFTGTGDPHPVTAPRSTTKRFFRVTVSDQDTDADSISDWAEQHLARFSHTSGESASLGTSDADTLRSLLSVTASVEVLDAYEKENTVATVRVTRSFGTMPLHLYFNTGGDPDPAKGSATTADFNLRNGTTGAFFSPGAVTFPAGATTLDIHVHPKTDDHAEVPETLTFDFLADIKLPNKPTTSAAVRINDATPVPANNRLFVAYLNPVPGTASSGSGIATVLLRGDNAIGDVNVSFNNLTSLQTAGHIHVANPATGPEIHNFGVGQLSGEPWFLKPAVFLASQQDVLDALDAGRLYINLASEININGEIAGTLRSETGSTELQPPPVAPPVQTLTDTELKRDVARFLTQATFGPSMEDIDTLYDDVVNNFGGDRIAAFDAWIEVQKDVPYVNYEFLVRAADDEEFERRQTTPTTYTNNNHPFHNNRRREWWTIALQAPDQLRQRTAFALSQIFVVSEQDATLRTRHYGLANYYGMLVNNAFRPYRRLLEDVSLHPAMGIYLSHLKNRKAYSEGGTTISPDENYAREIMQLFSIGLVKRHDDGTLLLGPDGLPVPTYNQTDITEMARVFTGLSFSKYHANNTGAVRNTTNFFQGNGHRYYQAPWTNPMRFFNAYHDENEKILLGGSGDPDGDGVTIPARDNNGPADLRDALDLLAGHPSTAPFISRLLIQRFTTSNPSRGYLYRVVKAWENATPVGDLDDVVKAILLDPEARNLDTIDQVGWGKQREPVLRFTHLLRATDAWTGLPLSDLTNRTAYAGLGTFAQSELDKFAAFDRPGPETGSDPVPVDGPVRFRMGDLNPVFAQAPLNADSVFNFYLPDYTVPGPLAQAGLSTPEFMLTTETNAINQINYTRSFIYASNINGSGSYVNNVINGGDNALDNLHPAYRPLFDVYNDTFGTTADKSAALVDHLDLVLCAGNLKARYGDDPDGENPRNAILKGVRDTSYGAGGRNRVRAAVYLVTSSPEYIIQK